MMARYLALTDGTTTIQLNGTPTYTLQSYVPRSPDLSTVDFTPQALRDGGERVGITRRNVTESARILISVDPLNSPEPETARTALRAIESLLEGAHEFQRRGLGARVYIVYSPQGGLASTDLYRSELLSGRVELGEGATGVALDAGLIEILLTWTRRYYWEANAETEVSLANTEGSGTGGRTVYNHWDPTPTHDNYVSIAAASITGAIPAACRLEVKNMTNNANAKVRTLFVAQNVFSGASAFTHLIEGETATGGAAVDDATCSGTGGAAGIGQYRQIALGALPIDLLFTWQISAAQLTYCASNWFRVLARFQSLPTAVMRLQLRIDRDGTGNTNIWTGPLLLPDPTLAIQDLGAVQLPPYFLGGTAASLYLQMWGYATTGMPNFNLDFLQLSPLDGYRVYTSADLFVAYLDRLVDDGVGNYVYVDTPATPANGRQGGVVAQGGPLLLWPNANQQLYFLQRAWTSGAPTDELAAIDRTLLVRLYYRPRRLTL